MPSPSAIAWLNLLTARIVIGEQPKPFATSIVSVPMRTSVALAIVLVLAGGAQAARVVGTAANDRLVGTPRADTILGREGRDRLVGNAGTDFLNGGPGSDVVDAGPGADRIVAQYDGARDVVRCGPGSDVVNADLRRSRRRGLRARQPTAVARSVHGRRGSARVGGRAGQPHGRAHHRRDLPGRATVQRRGGQRRLRGVVGQREHLAKRAASRPHTCEHPGRSERAGERPGRRVRRCQSRLADRDARARGPDDAPDGQPLDGRRELGRAGDGDRGLLGERNHVRQELDRVRQRRVQPPSRPLLPRLHRHAPRRPARGDHLERRRSNVVRCRSESR